MKTLPLVSSLLVAIVLIVDPAQASAFVSTRRGRAAFQEEHRQRRQRKSRGVPTVPSLTISGDTLSPTSLPFFPRDSFARETVFRQANSFKRQQLAPLTAFRGGATAVARWVSSIGASPLKCRILLVVSILLETCSTSLSKRARDIGSPILFVTACAIYLTWYV